MRTERSDTCLILSSEQRAPCRFIRARRLLLCRAGGLAASWH